MGLYPNFKPAGIRAEWEHTSMEESGSGRVLRKYGVPEKWGDPVDAVGWFANDARNSLRVLVADYADARRVTYRTNGRKWELSFEATPLPTEGAPS